MLAALFGNPCIIIIINTPPRAPQLRLRHAPPRLARRRLTALCQNSDATSTSEGNERGGALCKSARC